MVNAKNSSDQESRSLPLSIHDHCIRAFEFHPDLTEEVDLFSTLAGRLSEADEKDFFDLITFLRGDQQKLGENLDEWLKAASPYQLAKIRKAFAARNKSDLARAWAVLHIEYFRSISNTKTVGIKGFLKRKYQRGLKILLGPSAEEFYLEKMVVEILEARLAYAEQMVLGAENKSEKSSFWKESRFQNIFLKFSIASRLFFSSASGVLFPGWIPVEWIDQLRGTEESKASADTWFRMMMHSGRSVEWELRSSLYSDAFFKTVVSRMKRALAIAVLAGLAVSVNEWVDQASGIWKVTQPIDTEVMREVERDTFDAAKIRKSQIEEWKRGYERYNRPRLGIAQDKPFPWASSPHRERLLEFEEKMNQIPDESLRLYSF